MSKEAYVHEFADPEHALNIRSPKYWNPECDNFILMDWEKWESLKPSPPKIFEPPQKRTCKGIFCVPLWWWHRSCYCQPCVRMIYSSSGAKLERITDDEMFSKILGPHPESEKVPAPLRNKLFWMENNVAPETLVSFNRWSWRSNTKEGRIIGLGNMRYDWTKDPTCLGFLLTIIQSNMFATIQASPDGKWFLIGILLGGPVRGYVQYHHIYVVQEDDVFKSSDGKVIEHVKKGDILRIDWDNTDPYACDNSEVNYMYFPRPVAIFDEKTEQIKKDYRNYDDLLASAVDSPLRCAETCCYSCSPFMKNHERYDFQVSYNSNLQALASAPAPPPSQIIERL